MSEPRIPLPGSDRAPVPGAEPIGPVDPAEPITVTVVLRRRQPLPDDVLTPTGPLETAEFAARHGADAADAQRVRDVVTAAGAEVIEADLPSRRLRVRGPAGHLAALFGTELQRVRSPRPAGDGTIEHRHRQGALSVPADLGDVIVAVLGLDDRPQARAWLRPAASSTVSYTPLELGTIYGMPPNTDGSGRTVAIVELGGGYRQSDLDSYFAGLGIATPAVRSVGVDGAANQPGGDPSGADGEVLLDIEVAGALAPAAELVVYFAPNTDAGFLDAIATATHASPTPTAISISWGQSEDAWTGQSRQAMDAAFADAAALGVTVTAAAGDNGSSDSSTGGTGGTAVHVDFPAASPHVLGCGGTRLVAHAATGAISSETVWNDGASGGATGGGVSDTFALPRWQQHAGVPTRSGAGTAGRGVPDVAAVADPQTGYQVLVDGTSAVYGGTSAVAPLWAALVCRLAQALDRPLGLLQPALYAAAAPGRTSPGFRDVTAGDNGAYAAAPGWDACTGLGSPDGPALLAALRTPSPAPPPPAPPTP